MPTKDHDALDEWGWNELKPQPRLPPERSNVVTLICFIGFAVSNFILIAQEFVVMFDFNIPALAKVVASLLSIAVLYVLFVLFQEALRKARKLQVRDKMVSLFTGGVVTALCLAFYCYVLVSSKEETPILVFTGALILPYNFIMGFILGLFSRLLSPPAAALTGDPVVKGPNGR